MTLLIFFVLVVAAGALALVATATWLAVEPWREDLTWLRNELGQARVSFSSFASAVSRALDEEGTLTTPKGEVKTFTLRGMLTIVLVSVFLFFAGWAFTILWFCLSDH
ncbi:hypothetical protein IT399_01050 [Candidatus Nomurabacteria bacterium]|nr:hypothetical protein [Candidatus Nomurabacteria bacterium]